MIICLFKRWVTVLIPLVMLSVVECEQFKLSMDAETDCGKVYHYQAGDEFLASANNSLHGGNCSLTFLWSISSNGSCSGICVSVPNFRMDSCNVDLAYHDGVNDINPPKFTCRSPPPPFWCSSKNSLIVSVSQKKNNKQETTSFSISLKIQPFCVSLLATPTIGPTVSRESKRPTGIVHLYSFIILYFFCVCHLV